MQEAPETATLPRLFACREAGRREGLASMTDIWTHLDVPRLDRILSTAEGKTVLVVGDVMLDRYWTGKTSRISPEAPVPVVRVTEIDDRPGGAANVALNVASLGGQSVVVGATGNDAEAEALRASLRRARVLDDFEPVDGFATTTKLPLMATPRCPLPSLSCPGMASQATSFTVSHWLHSARSGPLKENERTTVITGIVMGHILQDIFSSLPRVAYTRADCRRA